MPVWYAWNVLCAPCEFQLSAVRYEFMDCRNAMKCIVCCLSLPRTTKRRTLSSPATKHIIPMFNEFVEANYPAFRKDLWQMACCCACLALETWKGY